MVSITDIENFWTRGDLYSRINQAMSDSGLNNKKLEIEDLFPIDQYHARGIGATIDLGKRMPITENQIIMLRNTTPFLIQLLLYQEAMSSMWKNLSYWLKLQIMEKKKNLATIC